MEDLKLVHWFPPKSHHFYNFCIAFWGFCCSSYIIDDTRFHVPTMEHGGWELQGGSRTWTGQIIIQQSIIKPRQVVAGWPFWKKRIIGGDFFQGIPVNLGKRPNFNIWYLQNHPPTSSHASHKIRNPPWICGKIFKLYIQCQPNTTHHCVMCLESIIFSIIESVSSRNP